MDINAGIVDMRLNGIVEKHADLLPDTADQLQKKSFAFVLLCISVSLDIPFDEAAELITDGPNDAGVDGFQIGDVEDDEFRVTLYQGKYRHKNLEGTYNFPENDIQKALNTLELLFDPARDYDFNPSLKVKVEEVRSLIHDDGYIPNVRFFLCSNGAKWNKTAQSWIEQATSRYRDKVKFVFFNHDRIVQILQRQKQVDTRLKLQGQAIEEGLGFLRVLVGRVSVTEIQRLFEEHGERLLERNIRRYLGMNKNRVNQDIHDTLVNPEEAQQFYFYNNGITVICDKIDYNAFQKTDLIVTLKNMQIINGGQTCKTIYETLSELDENQIENLDRTSFVMIRIYQSSDEQHDFVRKITYATNSQNPVDLTDLRSNDEIQRQLETGIKDLGYEYKRKRDHRNFTAQIIPSTVVAEAVLAIWRKRPHQAKFRRKEHFGRLYADIFQNLNPSQAILAVLIFREAKKRQSIPGHPKTKDAVTYATHYIAMIMGQTLLEEASMKLVDVDHRTLSDLRQRLENSIDRLYAKALLSIERSLIELYGDREISLQQLSATFRRGDLLRFLE